MAPQLIPGGLEVTVPLPMMPVFLTVRVKRCTAKVALTARAVLMVTLQVVPETVSHPLQPLKMDPLAGLAVRVTVVPLLYVAEQVGPQLILPSLEVTVPLPVPAPVTVKVTVTVKLFGLVAVPPGVVTLSGPVVAPAGTVA